jgi:hypothetical protein
MEALRRIELWWNLHLLRGQRYDLPKCLLSLDRHLLVKLQDLEELD